MLGIDGVLAPPEVGGICHKRIDSLNADQRTLLGTNDVRRAAGSSRVFKRVARFALGGIHANRHRVIRHTGAHHANCRNHGFSASLAGKFPVAGAHTARCADCFCYYRAAGFDGVRVRLGAHPYRSQQIRGDLSAFERVAGCLDGHGDHVFIQTSNRFFGHWQSVFVSTPNAGDLHSG